MSTHSSTYLHHFPPLYILQTMQLLSIVERITSIVNIANIHLITTIVSNTIFRTIRKSTIILPCSIQADLIHTLKWVLVHFIVIHYYLVIRGIISSLTH